MTETGDELTDTAPTEADPPAVVHRSRRSLITGAAAALGALAAQAVVLPSPASAAGVTLGGNNNTNSDTVIQNNVHTSSANGIIGRTTYTGPGYSAAGVRGVSLGTGGTGVYGVANNGTNARGVLGQSTNGYGVRGESTNNIGVYGQGGYAGVYTATTGTYGGVLTGTSVGVYAFGPTAVFGAGGTQGVYGSGTTDGVYGSGPTGVHGVSTESNGTGVYGASPYTGVLGSGAQYGVYGIAAGTSGTNYAVYGYTYSPTGYAGYFAGPVQVSGTLTKPAGSFKIDHPLDPERRWLSHSFVESPDMKNIYDGVATADARGTVTVTLPSYFDALNRTFRYQLTAIGSPAPSLHIARKITKRSFRIGGAEPGQEVSWMVTGIRQDDYANAHRIKVDTRKTKKERGTRLFVPKGSGAKRMDLRPAKPKHLKVAKPGKPRVED